MNILQKKGERRRRELALQQKLRDMWKIRSVNARAQRYDDERRREIWGYAFQSILLDVSPSLKILEVDLGHNAGLYMTSLVALTDLITHGGFPLLLRPPHTPTPILEPCRSLRRMHIDASPSDVHSSFFFYSIATFAPTLHTYFGPSTRRIRRESCSKIIR
jgi:hypothetical protein